jgi:hypothetical protein
MAEWEAEIKLRRNGRMVLCERSFGSTSEEALYAVHNDVQLWTQDDAPPRWPQDLNEEDRELLLLAPGQEAGYG